MPPSNDKAGGLACVAFALFGFLLLVATFPAFAAETSRVETPSAPPPALSAVSHSRRALRQIPLERDLLPGFTELAPGTSGAGPDYWLPNAFVNEVPTSLATQGTLHHANYVDFAQREVNAAQSALFELVGALRRFSVLGGGASFGSKWHVGTSAPQTKGGGLRRALMQIPFEPDLGPIELVPVPGTLYTNPFFAQVPVFPLFNQQGTTYASTAIETAKREFNAAPSAFFDLFGSLMRRSVNAGVDSGSSNWLVPPTLWPSSGK